MLEKNTVNDLGNCSVCKRQICLIHFIVVSKSTGGIYCQRVVIYVLNKTIKIQSICNDGV